MKKIKTLVRKEILDILRDKKTLIMMVVVPLLLYPLIIIGMSLIMVSFMQSQEKENHIVALPAAYEELADGLERLYAEQKEEIGLEMEFVRAKAGQEETVRGEADVWLAVSEEQTADSTKDGTDPAAGSSMAEAGMDPVAEAKDRQDTQLRVTICYASTSQKAGDAQSVVQELLEQYRETLVRERLEAEGLSETVMYPIICETEDQASVSESLGMDIGGSIGMMLIVTILLGAVYPAIDATAGEKERGTLETLLTLPVTNFQMITGKYISVAVFACTSAVISLLSLGGSVLFLIYGVAGAAMETELNLSGILTMLPVLLVTMIVTALLISALCMCFCVFAKSFKEANNYVTPLLLVVMFASMAAMIPSVSLDYRTALIPIVNVSLMVKQIIGQRFDLTLAGITIAINLVYSIVIVWVLARIYDSENVLFTDGFGSFRLFQKRADIRPGTIPAVGDLVISIALLFLLLLYVGSAASLRSPLGGTALSQVMILALPLFMAWYMKSDIRTLFQLKKPKWNKIPGSILLYAGTYCLVMELGTILNRLMPSSAENVSASFGELLGASFPLVLLVTAVMPAIGEEILFRGYIFGSLRSRMKAGFAILASALIFGAFHMSLVKLLPTALLGACFALIAASSGSIFPTMILHCLNNAVSMSVMEYPDEAMRLVPLLVKEELTVMEQAGLLAAGAVLAGLGLLLLRGGKRAVKEKTDV